MRSDIKGVSQCQPGQEQWEEFDARYLSTGGAIVRRVQYDYRTPSGKLFSTVAPTLEEARRRRDAWLSEQT